jgi:thymidylate synthase
MNELKFVSLGETWINLVNLTLQAGTPMGEEGLELLRVEVSFPTPMKPDSVVEQFAKPGMLAEMESVFFGNGSNALGHSYAKLMRGPEGRQDLEDVISLLASEPLSKRAVLTLCGNGGGKVPCINVIQFLVRDGALQTLYFARGQDAFRKFYADGWCVAKMAAKVAGRLGFPAGNVTGFIGSSHVYHHDRAEIADLLDRGRSFLHAVNGNGGL